MNWLLVVIGFFVHLVFFYSIFDIYFTSPLVHGMTPQYSTLVSPAKRLVLFVADGLRADKLYEVNKDGNSRAPFLRSKMLHGGAWGVSHTRVPTESRPGHVAIIAGFYEDVSAVMRGWKENPVEFDSLFNESFHTWSWGSPDILPMFAKGASGDHVSMEMYPGHSEDFAGANLAQLDTWVFDRVKDFLKSAKSDQKNVNHPLFQDRVVLFLHLLGLDTNGHVHKPYSETYLENIKTVDDGIQQLVDQMEETFQFDGKTAYIFTADHGMTNWGSHGAGDPSETLTPLIAWGAGIRSAQQSSSSQPSHSPPEWNVNHVRRTDVNQADLCPLMATLVGVPIPLQSVGTTPVDFLAGDDEFKAESLFVNARQILQQFEIKRDHKVKTTLSVLYRPFQPLTPAIQADEVRHIQQSIRERNFDDAIKRSYNLIQLALDGLTYYHHYDKVLLGASIAFGFIGWMTYIVTLVLQNHTQLVAASAAQSRDHNRRELMKYAFICVGLLVAAFLFVQSQKWTYYLYLELPVVLWYQALKRSFILKQSFEYLIKHKLLWRAVLFTALAVIGLELMVLTFFYRELLTIGLIGMAIWSVFSNVKSSNRGIVVCWVLACVALSVFPLLPVVGRASNYSLVYAAGIVALLPTAYVLYSLISTADSPTTWRTVYMIIVQDMLLVTSLFIVWNTAGSLGKNSGLPVINQCASWAMLASAFILPLFSSNRLLVRLAAIYLAFLPSYLLLSTSYEGLFNIVLCLLMFCWLNVESIQLSSCGSSSIGILEFNEKPILTQPSRKLVSGDLRCAYFFIFFLLSAFFGTGNIASINSFDPSSILCFVTVFNPFVMGALMLWKILIPFLLVTCTFNAVHRAANVPTQSLFLVVLLISDFMALHFFFLVRDYGSWLEIGMSISHYVIVMAMICFLFLLLTLSKFFTNWSFSRLLAVVLQRKSHEL